MLQVETKKKKKLLLLLLQRGGGRGRFIGSLMRLRDCDGKARNERGILTGGNE